MKKFHTYLDKIINIVEVDDGSLWTPEIGELIDYVDGAGIGMDVVDGVPVIPPPKPPPVIDWNAVDQDTLNATLLQNGSVLRAIAELTFIEINKLRQNAGLSVYTKTQFVAALKTKMR